MQSAISKSVLIKSYETALSAEGVGPRQCYRVGAVLFSGKRKFVNAKTNTGKSHPALKAFTNFPYLHAETNCVLSHGLDNCNRLSLCITRVRRDGQRTMARPCATCEAVIKHVGIQQVWYSNWNGEYECLES